MQILRLPSRVCLLALVTTGLLPGGNLRAQSAALDLNIRTTVEVPPEKSLGPHPTFVMAPAVQVASDEKLVSPVPEKTLLAVHRLLQEKLETQGYVGVPDKVRPEVLVTVQYGRGFLPNPYMVGMSSADILTGRTITMRGPADYLKRHELNYESKRQLAAEEKLYFCIAAWKFDSMRKGETPVRYWTTTIIVDDPDHRDLNQIYPQMIAAGAEFFNRRIHHDEIEVSTQVREGKVEVGIPQVVDDPKAKK